MPTGRRAARQHRERKTTDGSRETLTEAGVEIILDPRAVDVRLNLEVLDIGQHAAHLGALPRQALVLHHPHDPFALGRDHAELLDAVFADHVERELERLERHGLDRTHALSGGGGRRRSSAIGGRSGRSGGGGVAGAGSESADGGAAGGN